MLITLTTAGLIFSLYALWVERHQKQPGYKALCDINSNISCTKAFGSPQGRTFGIHNAWYGVGFYCLAALFFALEMSTTLFILTALACIKTLHLAYVSYVQMHNFCIVCTATYLINFALLWTVWPS